MYCLRILIVLAFEFIVHCYIIISLALVSQVFAAPQDVRQVLHLDDLSAADFQYTCDGDLLTTSIEGESDSHRFLQTVHALDVLGVDLNRQNEILRIIAGILYLGEVKPPSLF